MGGDDNGPAGQLAYHSLMSRKKASRPRARQRAKATEQGPSMVFWIALLLGLIMLAYLGYKGATTRVVPPTPTEVEQQSE